MNLASSPVQSVCNCRNALLSDNLPCAKTAIKVIESCKNGFYFDSRKKNVIVKSSGKKNYEWIEWNIEWI